MIDLFGKTEEGVNQGGDIDGSGVVAKGMEDGLHFKMGVGEGVYGDLKSAFESRTVGTDMKIDLVDGGCHRISIS